jgi:hypothetical protein
MCVKAEAGSKAGYFSQCGRYTSTGLVATDLSSGYNPSEVNPANVRPLELFKWCSSSW